MHSKFRRQVTRIAAAAAVALPMMAQAYETGPTTPGKWGPSTWGTGATLTYSFMPTGTSCADEFSGCTITAFGDFGPAFSIWRSEVQSAMAAWAAVANLIFIEVADVGEAFNAATQLSGDLRFGGHNMGGAGGTLAHGFYPPLNGQSAAGDIHFDTADCWEAATDGSGDGCFNIFQVTAHEIGHALGLDHTSVANSLMNPFYTEAFMGPQADDIAGMQALYGRAVTGTVPEPASLALVGLALFAASAARRRKEPR